MSVKRQTCWKVLLHIQDMCVFLQVGLEGVLLSSCSAAGMWRVRDLAGLGRDDLFSGLRYALSWMNTHTLKSQYKKHAACEHGHWFQLPVDPLFSFHFTFSAHLFGRADGWAHAEEGRTSVSSASVKGLRLRLQAEPGRGGWWWSDARRWTAIFNRTALVGLWTPKACRMWGWCNKQMEKGRSEMWWNRDETLLASVRLVTVIWFLYSQMFSVETSARTEASMQDKMNIHRNKDTFRHAEMKKEGVCYTITNHDAIQGNKPVCNNIVFLQRWLE